MILFEQHTDYIEYIDKLIIDFVDINLIKMNNITYDDINNNFKFIDEPIYKNYIKNFFIKYAEKSGYIYQNIEGYEYFILNEKIKNDIKKLDDIINDYIYIVLVEFDIPFINNDDELIDKYIKMYKIKNFIDKKYVLSKEKNNSVIYIKVKIEL